MWVYMVHPDIPDAETLVPEGAVDPQEARGWVRGDAPGGLDLDDPHAPLMLAESRVVPPGSAPSLQRPEKKKTRPAPSGEPTKEG